MFLLVISYFQRNMFYALFALCQLAWFTITVYRSTVSARLCLVVPFCCYMLNGYTNVIWTNKMMMMRRRTRLILTSQWRLVTYKRLGFVSVSGFNVSCPSLQSAALFISVVVVVGKAKLSTLGLSRRQDHRYSVWNGAFCVKLSKRPILLMFDSECPKLLEWTMTEWI